MRVLISMQVRRNARRNGKQCRAFLQEGQAARPAYTLSSQFILPYSLCVFPGTTERVCLIMGPAEAVRKVHYFIMEKIRDKPDPSPKPEDAKTNYERHRQVIEVFRFSIIIPVISTSCSSSKTWHFFSAW